MLPCASREVVAKLTLLAAVALFGPAAGGCSSEADDDPGDAGPRGDAGLDSSVDAPSEADAAATTCAYEMRYDLARKSPEAFPDDMWTVADSSSPTGLRPHLVDGENLALPASEKGFAKIFRDLSTLDGFGTTAPLYVTLAKPLDAASLPPSGDGSVEAGASVVLVRLDSTTPELVAFEWEQVQERFDDETTTLLLRPMVPLAPRARYAVAVTNRLRATDGGCFAPSTTMSALLAGTEASEAGARLAPAYAGLVEKLVALGTIASARELAGAVVVTTGSTWQTSAAIAADVRTRHPTYTGAGCVDPGAATPYLVCRGSFDAVDYRKDGAYVDDAAPTSHQTSYALPLVAYVPKAGTPPFKTFVYGHGLGGDKTQGERLAELAAPKGYATIAVDACEHGEHPGNHPYPLPSAGDTLNRALSFFGLALSGDMIDALRLRDNWRQSTYDKLQLVELMRPGLDLTGDGTPDVGVDGLVYLGVSLGGIMAAELSALSTDLHVTIPVVPGARVGYIIRDSQQFAIVITLFKGSASDGEVARFFPLLQTVIDAGDAGAYAGHVVRDRLAGAGARVPQTLMQMVIDDDTVPNTTNRFFARALGAPHVGDELQKIGTIAHEAALPVSGNVDAAHTAGVFQYDVVFDGDGPATRKATHSNVAANPLTITQTLHFVETYFSTGVSEIVDPYRTLGVKP